MWNNIATKKNPKQPDYRCKDKNCDGVIWPPKNGAPAPTASNGSHSTTTPTPAMNVSNSVAKRPLGPVYNECLDFANKACMHYFGKDVAASDVIAAAATLFIQSVKDNAPVRITLPAPVPAPQPDGYAQSNDKPLPF
jgi:hypothetical protein